ncbi:MAG: hypothetical protein JSV04_13345 [Candidatus Heimdallarchaeota archaeon]|nr:MAG: hypothetical protein JSV04_13345 [Candidatus Heimdallarchaeota archaeon]
MVYLRTTSLRRIFARYLTQFPDLFAGKLAEGIFLLKNNGKSLLLVLSEMLKHKGNIDVYVIDPVRIEDFGEEDSELRKVTSWLKDKNQARKILEDKVEDLPKDKARQLRQVTRRRFSIQLKLN